MLFKQIQVFQLSQSINNLEEKLSALAFTPCLPSLPSTNGWVPPLEDEENITLTRTIDGNVIFCFQIEEKLLPATVIRQQLHEKIKQIELAESRKIKQKEKLSLKDELTYSLLPRAFSKLTKIYAYIDTQNNWLIINTINTSKTTEFIKAFKKSVNIEPKSLELKKLSSILTRWLGDQEYPKSFSIEKACLLKDPLDQKRSIRCQQQNLFAKTFQAVVKDGYEVKQIALSWQDNVNFVLSDDFLFTGITWQDKTELDEISNEMKLQKFAADFVIMTKTFSIMIKELYHLFMKHENKTSIEEIA